MQSPAPQRPELIAEIGHRHHGDFDIAIRMTSAAAMAGFDAISISKFQAERVADPSSNDNYRLMKQAELRETHFRCLRDLAHEFGIKLILEPLDAPSLEWSLDHGDGVQVAVQAEHAASACEQSLPRGGTVTLSGRFEDFQTIAARKLVDSCDEGCSVRCLIAPDSESDLGATTEDPPSLSRPVDTQRPFGWRVSASDPASISAQAARIGATILALPLPTAAEWPEDHPSIRRRLQDWVTSARTACEASGINSSPAAPRKAA